MVSTDPQEIRRIDSQTLRILWTDGHVSLYEIIHLRELCRCAVCSELPPKISPDLTYSKVAMVGRYAISIEFSDGHQTGIYPFEFLRDNCPCQTCKQNR